MNYKGILFFTVIFIFLFYIYFQYDKITQYFPFENYIKFIVLIIGIIGIFMPQIISMVRDGKTNEEIKKFMIDKYKKK